MALQVLQGPLDHPETLEQPEKLVRLAERDHPDQEEQVVSEADLDCQETLVCPESQELKVKVEIVVPLEPQVQQELVVLGEQQEPPGHKGLEEPLVQEESPVLVEMMVHLEDPG